MILRRILTAVGAGLTTAIVVGMLVTELLEGLIEFSATLGLPIGLLLGAEVLGGILLTLDRFDTPIGQVLGAYGAFGYAVLGCVTLQYAKLAGARGTLGPPRIGAVAAVAALVVLVGLRSFDRRGRTS